MSARRGSQGAGFAASTYPLPSPSGGGLLAGNVVGPLGANRVVELSGDTINKIVMLDSGATIKQMQGGTPAAPLTRTDQSRRLQRRLPFEPHRSVAGLRADQCRGAA